MNRTSESTSSRWTEAAPQWNAIAIAEAVRERRVHPRRVIEESLSRISERDAAIGAFQVVRTDAARTEADAVAQRSDLASLPLAGVPVAVKDNIAVAGEPMRDGSAATSDEPQSDDHPIVRRLRAAGAVIVGTTRMPEFGLHTTTDSVYGITRNPWNLALTPGGSSGGSAAALASGMVPLAHGNDALGSIRIPAAACGLVGLKPGIGLVPGGIGETDWYGLGVNGILATTAADAAVGLSVIADQPDLAGSHLPARRLVIAASTVSPMPGIKPDSAYVRALNSVATVLARAGNEVHQADPDYSAGAAVAALSRWFVTCADEVRAVGNTHSVERRNRTHARIGRYLRNTSALDSRWRESFISAAEQFLSAYDLLVTPALARPPIEARDWYAGSWLRTILGTIRWTPYTQPWNVVGFPAIVIPTGKLHPRTKTPLAVQIVARPGREDLLLAVAGLLERFRPWPPTAPAYR